MPTLRRIALAATAVLWFAPPLSAQVGSSTDILTGRVTGPEGQAVQGARVEATSIETGVSRSRNTDAQGRYTILFPDGGGQYRVTARMLGLSPTTAMVIRQSDEDRLVHDFALTTTATTLDAVVVIARQAPRAGERPEPGSIERVISGEQLARLPIDATDPTILAQLQPGVIGIGATDTSAAAFSVAGQRTDQNLVTLDGLTFGTTAVPQEAVRTTRVITNTYDVARGQFTGGQVATTTRGGTSQTAGSFSYSLRDPRLEFDGEDPTTGQALASGYTQHQFSGGVGGPVVKDKLFYFGSFQLRRRLDPLQTLTLLEPSTLQRLGTSPDSAARFYQLVTGIGVPLTVPAVPDDRLNDNASLISRLDWHINDDHSLMFRGNWQGSLQDAFRTSTLALPSHAGKQVTSGAGAMLTLSSVIGSFLNEGRAFYSADGRNSSPYLSLPEGRVRVSSQLLDGTVGVSTLDFGGNTGMPTENANNQFELTDELSWLSGGGAHRFKLGGLYNHTGFSTANQNNRFGSFSFNSLADFENNQPADFRRSLKAIDRQGGSSTGAIYLGDTWRKSRSLQMTLGARLEGSAYDGQPRYNAAVDSAFGVRTDFFPHDVRISPRIGFTWQFGLDTTRGRAAAGAGGAGGAAGRGGFGGGGGGGGRGGGGGGAGGPGAGPGGGAPSMIVRGGVGDFRGRAPTQLFQSAIDATGLPSGEQQLVCVGAAVPVPDWTGYLADPTTVPSACLGAPGPVVSGQRPAVTVFSKDFETPRSVRASLGMTRRVGTRYGVNVDYTYALGTSLYGLRDLNLDTAMKFTLANELNRPVFAPANTVVPGSGATSLLASRLVANYGQVVQANSNLESNTHQLTIGVNGATSRNMIWNLSYTRMRSRDQTGFAAGGFGGGGGGGGGGGLTGAGGGFGSVGAGNPNAVEWGVADLQRSHSMVGTLTWLARPWLDLTSVFRVNSGQPYTPRVAGDINGDGARNDRAFVFDPANPAIASDTALVSGMGRLLSHTSGRAEECLRSQLGQIASRNSCVGAWTPSLDFQSNIRPYLGPRLQRRLTFALVAVNPLAGLDQLLHGTDKLHGWGQPNRPDATLLYVRGFNATTQAYSYQVNERFGDNAATRNAFRTPFMLGLTARLQVGPDRQREMMQGALNALNNRGGAAGFDFKAIMERIAPNPVKDLLRRRDSLKLTDLQVVRLQLIGDSLDVKNSVVIDSLSAQVKRLADSTAGRPGPGTAAPAPAAPPARAEERPGQGRVGPGGPGGPGQGGPFQAFQPLLQQGRNNYLAAVESIKGVLTPEQWNILPEAFRNPSLRARPGGPGGPGGAGRPQRPPAD